MMEIVGDSVSHSSDYFGLLADFAIKIIKDGKAYADDTDAATVRILVHNSKTLTNVITDETGENGRHCLEKPGEICRGKLGHS
jgi:glutamyl/glutaminyl-tRNA synthetase